MVHGTAGNDSRDWNVVAEVPCERCVLAQTIPGRQHCFAQRHLMLLMTFFAALWASLCCGFGWLVMRNKADRRATVSGSCLVILGLGGGWFIYGNDQQRRGETLFEAMAEGSVGVVAGAPAPVRQLQFVVEHPNVQHTLMVAPSAFRAAEPTGDAELSFQLKSPDGTTVIEAQRVYAVRRPSRSRAGWEATYHPFIPTAAGTYTLVLVLLTVDVPHVHVRVEDPEKTNGKRIPGW